MISICTSNILTQIRNNRQGTTIDSLTYKYRYNSDQKLIRNRLYHINDAVNSTAFNDDIDDQGNFSYDSLDIETANNYVRDKMGRLVKDKQEYIDTILWTATNKVKAVIKTPSDTLKNVYFDYDAFGNQIAKHVFNSQTMMLEKSTYYLLDAQSNQLSIYEHTVDTNESTAKYYLAERNIYGSSVLGTSRDTVNMMNPVTLPSYGIMGNRQYQLGEHRGNVLAVISDIKYPISSDNSTIDSYEVGITQITDYSPFGVELDGRTIQNSKYRYSFQNQEHHDEIKGKGNYMNYKYRGYDPRIGRLDWMLDPLAPKYPYYSPYQFSGNQVIYTIELEGLEPKEDVNKREVGEIGQGTDKKDNNSDVFNWVAGQGNGGTKKWMKLDRYNRLSPDEAASMSKAVYSIDKDNVKIGEKIYNSDWVLKKKYIKSSGFKAGLYSRKIDGHEFFTLAFAGTDDLNDVSSDINIGGGSIADIQLLNTIKTVQSVKNQLSGDEYNNLFFTGHSLGGGLAAFASMMEGKNTTTFNAMGIPFSVRRVYPLRYNSKSDILKLINAYIITGEILNSNAPKANGTKIYEHVSNKYSPIQRHQIQRFIELYNE